MGRHCLSHLSISASSWLVYFPGETDSTAQLHRSPDEPIAPTQQQESHRVVIRSNRVLRLRSDSQSPFRSSPSSLAAPLKPCLQRIQLPLRSVRSQCQITLLCRRADLHQLSSSSIVFPIVCRPRQGFSLRALPNLTLAPSGTSSTRAASHSVPSHWTSKSVPPDVLIVLISCSATVSTRRLRSRKCLGSRLSETIRDTTASAAS